MFFAPNNTELTTYNELKYKRDELPITILTTTLLLSNPISQTNNNLLCNLKDIHPFASNIQTTENYSQNNSTWNEVDSDNFDVFFPVKIQRTYKVRGRIKSISYYTPKIIID